MSENQNAAHNADYERGLDALGQTSGPSGQCAWCGQDGPQHYYASCFEGDHSDGKVCGTSDD